MDQTAWTDVDEEEERRRERIRQAADEDEERRRGRIKQAEREAGDILVHPALVTWLLFPPSSSGSPVPSALRPGL